MDSTQTAPARPRLANEGAAEFFADPASMPPEIPLFHSGRMITLLDGFFLEYRELWAGEQLIALNQQTFAVLR